MVNKTMKELEEEWSRMALSLLRTMKTREVTRVQTLRKVVRMRGAYYIPTLKNLYVFLNRDGIYFTPFQKPYEDLRINYLRYNGIKLVKSKVVLIGTDPSIKSLLYLNDTDEQKEWKLMEIEDWQERM
jgi:hypothetical protein